MALVMRGPNFSDSVIRLAFSHLRLATYLPQAQCGCSALSGMVRLT